MLEMLFEQCCQRAPDTPAYRQAMADILTAEEELSKILGGQEPLAKLTDAYAQREEAVALAAFERGFSVAVEIILDIFSAHK